MKTRSSFTELAVFWSSAFTSYCRPGTPTKAGWTALLLKAEREPKQSDAADRVQPMQTKHPKQSKVFQSTCGSVME